VYFFTFIAHPKPENDAHGEVDGAFVNVWVNDPLESSAEAAARALVEETGWKVKAREYVCVLAADHYAEGEAGLAYMEQARVDGICAVFHRWNADAPDE
jgi:hypothetical protein